MGDLAIPTTACALQRADEMLRDTCPDLGAADDLWRVRLAAGEQTMTLDELDSAFEAGRIDTETLVCAPGASSFARLGAVAGLDEPAPSPRAPAPEVAVDVALDFDLSELSAEGNPFRPRWSRRLLAVPAALAAIGIIAFAASASASSEPAPGVAADLHAAPSPAPVAAPAAPAPAPAAAPALSEEQKKALAAKDRNAEARRTKKAAAAPPRRFAASKSAPFTKGGNKHDPLNGSL